MGAKDSAIVEEWLRGQVALRLRVDPEDVDPEVPFIRYGLDSVQMVEIAEALSTWLGIELPATLLWDYPTLRTMAEHLSSPQPYAAAPS